MTRRKKKLRLVNSVTEEEEFDYLEKARVTGSTGQGDGQNAHTHTYEVDDETGDGRTTGTSGDGPNHEHVIREWSVEEGGVDDHKHPKISKKKDVKKSEGKAQLICKAFRLEVQQVVFDKEKFPSFEEAVAWAEKEGFEIDMLDDSGETYTFRQLARDNFVQESLKEIEISDGVKARIGSLKESAETEDKDDGGFEAVRDRINAGDKHLTTEQLRKLDRLKERFRGDLSQLKERLNRFIPIMNEFFELSLNLVENENVVSLMEAFTNGADALTSALNETEMEAQLDANETTGRFEDDLKKLKPLLKSATDMFKGTSFDKFGGLCKYVLHHVEQIDENVLPEMLTVKNSEIVVEKHLNNVLDLETIETQRLEKLSRHVVKKLKIKDYDTSLLKNNDFQEKLAILHSKFFTEKRAANINIGPRDKKLLGFVVVDKQKSEVCDLVHDVKSGLPFQDGSIDKIRAVQSLEYLDNTMRRPVMNEFHRVLKHEGVVEIEVPSTEGPNAFHPDYSSYWNEHVFKAFDGFEVVEMETVKDEESGTATVKCKLKAVKDESTED